MRLSFGSQKLPHPGQSLPETYLLGSLRLPDKTSEDRGKNAAPHNVELSVLISAPVFGPESDTTEGRKPEIKSRTTSRVSSVFPGMTDGAACITSTCPPRHSRGRCCSLSPPRRPPRPSSEASPCPRPTASSVSSGTKHRRLCFASKDLPMSSNYWQRSGKMRKCKRRLWKRKPFKKVKNSSEFK